jgi:hypothetical protein
MACKISGEFEYRQIHWWSDYMASEPYEKTHSSVAYTLWIPNSCGSSFQQFRAGMGDRSKTTLGCVNPKSGGKEVGNLVLANQCQPLSASAYSDWCGGFRKAQRPPAACIPGRIPDVVMQCLFRMKSPHPIHRLELSP